MNMRIKLSTAMFVGCLSAVTTIAAAAAPDAAERITRTTDGWMIKAEGSEFSENRNVTALKIDRDITTGLALRCSDHKKAATLRHYDATYDPNKSYAINLRVAKGPIQNFSGVASNNRTLVINEGEKFVDAVMGANRLALRLETGPGIFEEIVFLSKDMRKDLTSYLAECPVK